jgi:hypothetical protein
MSLTRSVVLLAALVLSACASGGGGGGVGGGGVGGGGGPVTPPVTPPPATPPKAPTPPATPYASTCASTPNAITCWGGFYNLGDFTLQELHASTGGPSFDYVAFDGKKTQRTDDDQWVFYYFGVAVDYRYYDTPVAKTDGLGRIRTAANYRRDSVTGDHFPGNGSVLTLYDISNVLQGGLDYVQLGSLTPAGASAIPTYFAVGSGYSRPTLPTTGTAKFDGGARGSYVTGAGALYSTLSDVTLVADFGKAVINGSASNFYVLDPAGAAAFAPKELNFSFTGTIETDRVYGPRFSGAATGTNATGAASGAFYGQPGQTPAEIGMSYKLTDTSGGTLIGVGGLKRNP